MDSALLFLSRLLDRSRSTRIADARESVAYWSQRHDELPWHRRAARREARERVTAGRAQLIGAHLEHTPLGAFTPRVAPLLDTRGRSAGGHMRALAFASMRHTAIGRKIMLAAGGFTVAAVALAALATAFLIHAVAL
jgi:hypothetical protein